VAVLVVADIHANIEAFRAVLDDAERRTSIDSVWCLGDIVGYGPDPAACIEALQGYEHVAIAGNHDLAAADALGLEEFNSYAAAAVRWTRYQLSEGLKAWLKGLPLTVRSDDFTLVHGSLLDPVWDYLVSPGTANAHLDLQATPYCLVGHSHLQLVFYEGVNGPSTGDIELGERRFVANPGSVGQPRDGDPRAAYAIVDPEGRRVAQCRVAYDIRPTQTKIRAAGLPAYLADRLAAGR
jgi:diadenosine tetraphosphatase ApaH/serine/threonine PP2A family protein phosphatase